MVERKKSSFIFFDADSEDPSSKESDVESNLRFKLDSYFTNMKAKEDSGIFKTENFEIFNPQDLELSNEYEATEDENSKISEEKKTAIEKKEEEVKKFGSQNHDMFSTGDLKNLKKNKMKKKKKSSLNKSSSNFKDNHSSTNEGSLKHKDFKNEEKVKSGFVCQTHFNKIVDYNNQDRIENSVNNLNLDSKENKFLYAKKSQTESELNSNSIKPYEDHSSYFNPVNIGIYPSPIPNFGINYMYFQPNYGQNAFFPQYNYLVPSSISGYFPNQEYFPKFPHEQINNKLYSHSTGVSFPNSRTSSKEEMTLPEDLKNSCLSATNREGIEFINITIQKEDFINYICSPNGCKEFQRKFQKTTKELSEYFLLKVIEYKGLDRIMTNPHANYLFQKKIQFVSPEIRIFTLKEIEKKVDIIGTNISGTHCIQKYATLISSKEETNLFIDIICKRLKIFCFDCNGVHIILKAITCIKEEDRIKLSKCLLSMLNVIVLDAQGVCVVRNLHLL